MELLTIEQYERWLKLKRKHDEAERLVNFLWKLKQPLWTSYTLEERQSIDKALEDAEHKMCMLAIKCENVLKYRNIQKYNRAQSA